MSWMDSWSRPSKSQATPPPLYLTSSDVPYCHSCGRVISQRRTQTSKTKTQEVKYCSSRCRNSKPGALDRKIESVFAALLDGATPESLLQQEGSDGEVAASVVTGGKGKDGFQTKEKAGGKAGGKKKKAMKGDPRVIVECGDVEAVVFQHEKDPEKVHGRKKNRGPRGVVEKPEDWRSVDMVDDNAADTAASSSTTTKSSTETTTAATTTTAKRLSAKDSAYSHSADDNSSHTPSSGDEDENEAEDGDEKEGSITLDANQKPSNIPDTIPLNQAYGFGGGKIRPPQSESSINGSIGGEKGWAERIEETDEMKAKRREGQRRAEEREMVRRAARRLVAFGVGGDSKGKGEGDAEGEKRKCEAVMKGAVVEASFAKGEWGVRWREKV